MHEGERIGGGVCAARTVAGGAHGARHNVAATAAVDCRSLDALRNEARAAIGAAMRSSARSRRPVIVNGRACSLCEAAAS